MPRTPLANTIMLTPNETPLSVQQPTSGIINDFFQNLLMLRNHIRSILLSLSRHHTLVTVYAAPLEGAAAAPICGSLLLSCRMTSCGSPFFTSADLIYGFKKRKTELESLLSLLSVSYTQVHWVLLCLIMWTKCHYQAHWECQ